MFQQFQAPPHTNAEGGQFIREVGGAPFSHKGGRSLSGLSPPVSPCMDMKDKSPSDFHDDTYEVHTYMNLILSYIIVL